MEQRQPPRGLARGGVRLICGRLAGGGGANGIAARCCVRWRRDARVVLKRVEDEHPVAVAARCSDGVEHRAGVGVLRRDGATPEAGVGRAAGAVRDEDHGTLGGEEVRARIHVGVRMRGPRREGAGQRGAFALAGAGLERRLHGVVVGQVQLLHAVGGKPGVHMLREAAQRHRQARVVEVHRRAARRRADGAVNEHEALVGERGHVAGIMLQWRGRWRQRRRHRRRQRRRR
mmetsp:Transcript_20321/g.61687  ORF Transcript_20321/g.61687 Transcript_20321/m.61687 type:complete len:231 (+) Transcript_20321:2757-3449(+)